MRIYWTDFFNSGNIGMFARPRGNDWLEDEIMKIKQSGITTVISLLEKSEISELELERESKICEELELDFINFPIPDRGLPESKKDFKDLIDLIVNRLAQNQKIGIHCRMGIGRTSLLTGAVLKEYGMENLEIFNYLSEKRTLTVPDTQEQVDWVMAL